MNVFLAMLRDSFREALDSKVLYVLAGFSLLFSLFCLSVGFKDRPYNDAVKRIFTEQEWRKAHIPTPEGNTPNLLSPEVEDVQEESGSSLLRVRIKVEKIEEFVANVIPFESSPSSLDEMTSGKEIDLLPLEGRSGFEHYLLQRLALAGFRPVDMDHMGDDRWEIRVKPAGKFSTQGAQSMTLFFGLTEFDLPGVSGRDVIFSLQNMLANSIGGWLGILIAIVVTAWFVPGMLQKGSVDLMLARPVPRWQILLFKYIGGLVFVFLNATILIGGTWVGLTLATGFVHGGYLLCVITITILFAIVYAISLLASVLFQNVVLSIVFPVGFWFACSLINKWALFVDSPFGRTLLPLPGWVKGLTKAVYYVMPATTDIGQLNAYFMILGEKESGQILQLKMNIEHIDFAGSITTSLIFTAVVIALSAWIFHRKDF